MRVWEKGVPSPGPSLKEKTVLIVLIFGGFFKCQEFALAKAVESNLFARMDCLTIIGTFVVRTVRMQTSENEFKQNGSKRKLVLVLCAATGFRESRQIPLCRVTRRPERLSYRYPGLG